MAKLGFIILVLIFGASTFVAGVVAPEEIADPVRLHAQQLYERWNPATAPAVAAVENATENTANALPYSQLIQDVDYGEKVGIQVGLYSSTEEAQLLQSELKQLKLPVATIPVRIADNFNWILLASGPYADTESAQLNLARLRDLFGYERSFDLIRWPQTPKTQ